MGKIQKFESKFKQLRERISSQFVPTNVKHSLSDFWKKFGSNRPKGLDRIEFWKLGFITYFG